MPPKSSAPAAAKPRGLPNNANAGGNSHCLARIYVCGSFRGIDHLGQDIVPRSRRASAILAYLIFARGKAVSRSRLASLLWDRVPEGQARASLRQALSEVTTSWQRAREALAITRETVRLDVGRCWVDLLAFYEATECDVASVSADMLGNISARLLDGFDGMSESLDDWLRDERSRAETTIRSLHEKRISHLVESAAPPDIRIQAARQFAEFDATHELAWRTLMKALVEKGDRSQALREYQRCRDGLRRLLDVEPSKDTKGLYEAIRVNSPHQVASVDSDGPFMQCGKAKRPTRIRIGVMPFAGIGPAADPLLPSTLSLDAAAMLARFRWFDVIAPMALSGLELKNGNSRKNFEGMNLDYLMQGSIRVLGTRIFVHVVLMKTDELAKPVWNDTYELPLRASGVDVNRIVTMIAGRANPVILFAERTRSDNHDIHDATALVLSAIPLMYSMDPQKYARAGSILARAVKEWPEDSMAAAWRAFWYMFNVAHGWSHAPVEEYAEAEELSRKAIELDPENAEALGIFAHLCCYVHHDFDGAAAYFDRSLSLNPSLAFVWALSAPNSCYSGNTKDALARLQRYRDLVPLDPYYKLFETMYVTVYTFARDYEKAAAIGRRAVRANPHFTNVYKPLIASLGHLGRIEEAAPYLQELLRQEPSFCIRHFAKRYPFRFEVDRAQYVAGLRKAGAPES